MMRVFVWGLGFSCTLVTSAASAQWMGFVDQSEAMQTQNFTFGAPPTMQVNSEAGDSNENYYDGDFGDFDGDGRLDRALISRYGLLWNVGGGVMTPLGNTVPGSSYRFGDKDGVGNDAVQWADVDNDGDLDVIQGGNGEALVLQLNARGRFSSPAWGQSGSAKRIIKTDIQRDGAVDLIISGAFCLTRDCGQPDDFTLLVNDGAGNFTEQTVMRGLPYASSLIAGVRSGDINGDGDFDLMLASGTQMKLLAMDNDGMGNFTERAIYDIPMAVADMMTTWGAGLGMSGNGNTDLGDVDGDGDVDYLVACLGPMGSHAQVYHALFINDGFGGFSEDSAARFDVGTYMGTIFGTRVKLVDIDYDGDLDIVGYMQSSSADMFGLSGNHLHGFLNDGSGNFTMMTSGLPTVAQPVGGNINAFDVADLDGDGSVDLWVGNQGGRVRTMLNTYSAPGGDPADLPRNLQVVSADASGVRLRWEAPPWPSTVRFYRVYRAAGPGLPVRDRQLIKTVAISPHADESLVVPITSSTTTSYLGDADVTLDGANDAIEYLHTTSDPGTTWFYSVVHVGNETGASAPTPEVSATIPYPGGADAAGPELVIHSPHPDDWSTFARIVLHYSDDDSGVDLSTLSVTFDADLGNPMSGGRAMNTNVSDVFMYRDDRAFIAALSPPLELPLSSVVTMTASLDDNDGNTTTEQVSFFTGVQSASLPTAAFTPSSTSGNAPLTVSFDGSASSDADGKVVRREWYFGDGGSAIGLDVSHTYAFGGSFTAALVVRDTQGGVDVATAVIDVTGGPPQCTNGAMQACYTGAPATENVGPCVGGTQTCLAGAWGPCVGETVPVAEACDTVDNDCDGSADEDWPALGSACTAGLGLCASSGMFVCDVGGGGMACDATLGTPGTEVCDGTNDEDCDGTVDNGCPCTAGSTRSCYSGPMGTEGVGACVPGTQSCVAGAWAACQGDVVPTIEECSDSLDNDCDGQSDAADADCGAGMNPAPPDPGPVVGPVASASCGCHSGGTALWASLFLAAFVLRRRRSAS